MIFYIPQKQNIQGQSNAASLLEIERQLSAIELD
jgi:hypothetical protein